MAPELASSDADWQAEMRFLSAASSYPSSPAGIEVIETTMSLVVFLTEDYMIRDGVVRAVASLVRACRCGRGGQLRESPAG